MGSVRFGHKQKWTLPVIPIAVLMRLAVAMVHGCLIQVGYLCSLPLAKEPSSAPVSLYGMQPLVSAEHIHLPVALRTGQRHELANPVAGKSKGVQTVVSMWRPEAPAQQGGALSTEIQMDNGVSGIKRVTMMGCQLMMGMYISIQIILHLFWPITLYLG